MEDRWSLVGRDAELALIDSLRRDGARGVVVGGAAGVGKTRLVQEVVARAAADGWTVEEVVATAAAHEIPLGACASLRRNPDDETHDDALGRLIAEVRARVSGPALLVVDDAQWLDAASAQAVAILARTTSMFVLLALRSGEPVHDAVRGVWKDDIAQRIELQALSEMETALLVERAIGGRLERETARRVFAKCQGNVLFLRELLLALVDASAFEVRDGVWRWLADRDAPSARLDEIIGERLSGLSASLRRALELVALGEPLEVGLVDALGIRDDVVGLERASLAEVRVSGRRRAVHLAHPLYGEVALRESGQLEGQATRARLARALAGTGLRRRGDRLRLAVWQVAAGEAHDPDLLMRAAADARARGEIRLMRQLAGAAAQVGGGTEARVLVALATRDSGADEQAVPILSSILDEDLNDETRARVTEVIATSLAHKLGRADEARALIVANADRVTDAHARRMLEAVHRALFTGEEPPFTRIHDDDDSDETPAMLAWIGQSQSNLMAGRFTTVYESSSAMRPVAERLRETRPEGRLWIGVLRFYACMHLCKFDEAEQLARGALQLVLDHPQGTARAWWLDLLGTAMLERGKLTEAVPVLEEAAALRRRDDPGLLVGSLLMLGVARAQLGQLESAAAALDDARSCPVGLLTPLVEMPRAEAALLAAQGRVPSAQQLVVAYARDAHAHHRNLYEFWAWRDAARYGAVREAHAGITALAPLLDGPIGTLFVDATDARLRRDARALLDVATALEANGLWLDAGEHLHVASEFATAADARPIRRSLERLRPHLVGVRTPMIAASAGEGPSLSKREREIAVLAAAGMRDADIAHELVLSVRTVNAHLRAVYTKLGITSRHEIAGVLNES